MASRAHRNFGGTYKENDIIEILKESRHVDKSYIGQTANVTYVTDSWIDITLPDGEGQTIFELEDMYDYDTVKLIERGGKKVPTKKTVTKVASVSTVKLPTKKLTEHEVIGQDHNKKLLKVAIEKDFPILLIGETGTAKTTIIREQAIAQKHDWIRFNLTGETTVDEFVGKYELEGGKTVWRDGILLQAMKKGQWLIVDEVNVALPEILFVLHSLLDDDKFVVVASHAGEVIRPEKGFRFFATMNPVDEYAGTKELNKAFQSRFPMVLHLDYPDNKVETRIVTDKSGVPETTAVKMADVANAIRKLKKEEKIFYTCSTRDLIQWGKLISAGLKPGDAFAVSIVNKANGDKDEILKVYKSIMDAYFTLETASGGVELSYEYFAREQANLEEQRKEFLAKEDAVRKQITEEIIDSLSKKKPTKEEVIENVF